MDTITLNYPDNYSWDFIEANLPKYHSRDDVMESDLLQRYIDGETSEFTNEDFKRVETLSHYEVLDDVSPIEKAKIVSYLLDIKLFHEAFRSYIGK